MTTADTVLLACTCVITVLVCTMESIHVLYNAKDYCSRAFETVEGYFNTTSRPEDQQRYDAQSPLARRLTEIRVESYLTLLNVSMHLGAVLSASWLLRLMLGLPRLGDFFTFGLTIIAYLSALVLRMRPERLNQSNIWILHCWNMGLLFSYGVYLALSKPQWFVHYYPPILGFRAFLSVVYPVAQLNIFWNVAWIVVGVLGMRNAGGIYDEIPISNVVQSELLVAVFFCYMVWKLDGHQTSQVRSDIQANWYLRAKKTMEKLLADMCDAVVELDPDLVIRSACPKLADLLIRDAGASMMKHEDFSGLVFTEQDRGRFIDFVTERAVPVEEQQSLEGAGRGSSIYVHLRDVTGSPVSVQLFHSCHYNPSDEICHVVGVREVDMDTPGRTQPGAPLSPRSPSGQADFPPLIVEPSPPSTAGRKPQTSQIAVSDDEQPRQGHIDRREDQEDASQAQPPADQGDASQAQPPPDQDDASQAQPPPQDRARRTSDGDESDASSSASAHSSRSRKVMLDGFQPTSGPAIIASTLRLLTLWNVTFPRQGCCSFHALLREAEKTIKWLDGTGCQQFHERHLAVPPWQCPQCGIIWASAAAAGFDSAMGVCSLCRSFRSSTQVAQREASSPTLIEM